MAVLLVVGFFVYPYWSVGLRHGATSQSTVDVPIVLLSNVTYGILTVNGKQSQTPPPVIASLHVGKNSIDLQTPPFLPQHCDIMWPEQVVTGSTCQINRDTQEITVRGHSVRPVFLLDMLFTAAQLPQDARDSALHLVGETLTTLAATSSELVPAGQYFGVGNLPDDTLHVYQSAASLQAQVVTDAPLATALGGAPDCSNLGCASHLQPEYAISLPHQLGASNVWQVGSAVSLRLDFSTAVGTSMGSITLSTYQGLALFLSYTPGGGWHIITGNPTRDKGFATVSSQIDQALCDAGNVWMSKLAQRTLPATSSFNVEALNSHGLKGCEFQMEVQQSDRTQSLRFVWRFGALLAENAAAHQLFPSIPLAPREEITAVTT